MIQVSFAPSLPADWPFLRFEHYAVGGGRLNGEVEQSAGLTTLRMKYEGPSPIKAVVSPAAPALARVNSVRLDDKAVKFSVQDLGSLQRVEIPQLTLVHNQQATIIVQYDGGIAVVPPSPRPQAGEPTESLKILDVVSNPKNPVCLLQVSLAGIGGRTYPLRVVSSLPNLRAGALRVRATRNGYEVEIPFEGAGYTERQVCLGD